MKKLCIVFIASLMSFSAHALLRLPIGITALQVAYSLRHRCEHSYKETKPLVEQIYQETSKHDTFLAQANALQVTLKEQLNNPDSREKYFEAYRSIGGTSAIVVCSICFIFKR
jgi:hypothetical protein